MSVQLADMYRYLISHTFPGFLLLGEMLLAYEWFIDDTFTAFLQETWSGQAGNMFIILILMYTCATILGIIVDAIHHFLFEDIKDRIFDRIFTKHHNTEKEREENPYDAFKSTMSVDVYNHFIDDDYYYYYEAYANTFLAMLPGGFLLWYWLSSIRHYDCFKLIVPVMVYAIILAIMFLETIFTKMEGDEQEELFTKSFAARPTEISGKEDTRSHQVQAGGISTTCTHRSPDPHVEA